MKVQIKYTPSEEKIMKIKPLKLIAKFKYQLAPELRDEFDESKLEREWEMEMPRMIQDGIELKDINFFEYETELPYGSLKVDFHLLKSAKEIKQEFKED